MKSEEYRQRVIDEELSELLSSLPAIVLEGPKGVGKTATAMRRANAVFKLDSDAELAIVQADPKRVLSAQLPTLLDEWQRLPELWDIVRRAVDDGAAPASFLLTGSASPNHLQTHTGAARMVTLRLRPLSLAERLNNIATVSLGELLGGQKTEISGETEFSLTDYVDEILRSGFPGIRHLEGRALRSMLDGYLRRIIERDFVEFGTNVRRPKALLNWMRAYAAASSTTATYETIRDAATAGDADKLPRSTTQPYRDTLEKLWILDPIPAWIPSKNPISRLARSPKHQLADPALAARLLGITRETLLAGEEGGPTIPRDGTLLGHLFESLAVLSIRVYAQQAEAMVSHFHTSGGNREVDIIVERADGRALAIEVKLSQKITDHDVRHLHWLEKRLGNNLLDKVLLNTGTAAYRRRDGVAVVPLALLGV